MNPTTLLTTLSVLLQLKSSIIRVGRGGPATCLTLCEVMGVGDEESSGLCVSDALAVINGHVPEGHRVTHFHLLISYTYKLTITLQ